MNAALINPFTNSATAPSSVLADTAGAPPQPPVAPAGQSVSDGVGAKPILAPSEAATVSGRAPVAATLSHNKITQAVEIQSSCGGVEGHAPLTRDVGRLVETITQRDTSVGPLAGIKPGPQEAPNDELARLIGVAGKRRRRPLALPRFVPDEDAIEAAARDSSSPRALETDPVWADEPPIFLKG